MRIKNLTMLVLALALLVSGCRSKELEAPIPVTQTQPEPDIPEIVDKTGAIDLFKTDPIPFETRKIPSQSLNLGPEPTFRVLTSSDSVANIDFDQYLLIVVSRGLKPDGYRVKIEKIGWFNGDIRVEFSTTVPPEDDLGPAPKRQISYEAVLLEREVLKNPTEVRFNLTPVGSVQQTAEYRWPTSENEVIPKTSQKRTLIYFPAKDNPLRLIGETRLVNSSGDVFRQAVSHLIDGPRDPGSRQGFSRNTWIRSIRAIGDQVILDLSVPGWKNYGAAYQETLIGSLANTLTEFPRIGRVQINLEGKLHGIFKRQSEMIIN